MKNVLITSLVGGAMLASAVQAEISGNIALTSDYFFRGISQTSNAPAVQGGFDYSHESGFYAGVWGSNVDFDDSLELDLYAGIAGESDGGIGWDIGVLTYQYPGDNEGGAADSDFTEIYGGLSYDFGSFSAGLTLNYSSDYFLESDDALYVSVDVGIPLGEKYELALHWGDQSIDDNAAWGTPDYNDWSVGISTEVGGIGLDLTYVDTDLSSTDCFGGDDICDSSVVFTISKSL